jgi:hypothetical protein
LFFFDFLKEMSELQYPISNNNTVQLTPSFWLTRLFAPMMTEAVTDESLS